jgi:hypothetical protein
MNRQKNDFVFATRPRQVWLRLTALIEDGMGGVEQPPRGCWRHAAAICPGREPDGLGADPDEERPSGKRLLRCGAGVCARRLR